MTAKHQFFADEELDDFESDDFEDIEDADDTYLSKMWGGYGWNTGSRSELAAATVTAHGMVQSFVNAFARDGHYAVTFDANTKTAGTDLTAKFVVITPAPIADRTLSPEEAGKILTGLAVHEISHPRYGRNTWAAINAAFPGNGLAHELSNFLDDIRIERRFIEDYPGYAGIFVPVLDYVGKGMVADNGGKLITASMTDLRNLAILALRYETFAIWDEITKAEAAWWTAWSDRWAKENAPRRHVAAIREALAHIANTQQSTRRPSPQTGNGQPGASKSTQSDGNAKSGTSDQPAPSTTPANAEDASKDAEINAATQALGEEAKAERETDVPSCSGSSAVTTAARENGASRHEIHDLQTNAQAIIDNARETEDDGHGNRVDVAKSTRGIIHNTKRLMPSAMAARHIRNAIMRSRTGNGEVTRHQGRGRLDNHSLARIATGDTRLFERRRAPSIGTYNVWVMVDCSGSMCYTINEAAQVAEAIASASTATPTVRVTVWGWSDAFRKSMAGPGVAKVWETGMPTEECFKLTGLKDGGTPDAQIMGWASRAIKRATHRDETPVIIFVSDGMGYSEMKDRVAEARDLGVTVKSVSFGSGMSEDAQTRTYGKGNFVPFAGTIIETARGLGKLFADITSGR